MTVAEYESDFEPTTGIPYLTLTGELWGVYITKEPSERLTNDIGYFLWYPILLTPLYFSFKKLFWVFELSEWVQYWSYI